MTLGRLHLSGPNAWPDHLLDHHEHGIVMQVWRLVLGAVITLRRSYLNERPRHGLGYFAIDIYLVFWAFELYLDLDGSFEE